VLDVTEHQETDILEVSMQPEGPATGHLDTAFLVFLCFQLLAEMVSKIIVATTSFSSSPPSINSPKLYSSAVKDIKLFFHIIEFHNHSENKNFPSRISNHPL
jgi:hypothetical protein